MKTISLKGGLGNQLFQYAYGRNLEHQGQKIIFNTSFFYGGKVKSNTARDYKLDKFNIETAAKFSTKKTLFLTFLNRILNRLSLKNSDYYQNEKYFKNIEGIIRKEFTLKNPLTKESQAWQEKINRSGNSISVHIRRGDYIQDKKTKAHHGACDMEYYKKALEIIKLKSDKQSAEIFVFSDDINWTKENINFSSPTYFISNPQIPDYEEMYLMSLCKHQIIANSTFSWWSAWLNQNVNKIVVAPKQWLANKTANELDILPKTWIQI